MSGKRPLLLLHGALGSKAQLAGLKKELNNKFNPISLNFAGHGGLPIKQSYSINNFAHQIINYITNNKLSPVDIFGYSMGGYVALKAAAMRPEMIENIVCLATKFDWSKAATEKEIKRLNPKIIEDKVPQFAKLLAQRHQPNVWKNVLKNTADMMQNLTNNEAITNAEFKKIKAEVIIGIGSADKMVSIGESRKAAQKIGNATLKILEGWPHPIEQIEPKQLVEFIRSAILKK